MPKIDDHNWEFAMDSPLVITVFGFGAILLLIAVLNGSFKIYGAEISGNAGRAGRIVAGVLGLLLILFGLDKGGFLDSPEATQIQMAPPGAGADQEAPPADDAESTEVAAEEGETSEPAAE
ncbi:MAG: hypothetical protein ACK4F7_07285 [Inhella sp.]